MIITIKDWLYKIIRILGHVFLHYQPRLYPLAMANRPNSARTQDTHIVGKQAQIAFYTICYTTPPFNANSQCDCGLALNLKSITRREYAPSHVLLNHRNLGCQPASKRLLTEWDAKRRELAKKNTTT